MSELSRERAGCVFADATIANAASPYYMEAVINVNGLNRLQALGNSTLHALWVSFVDYLRFQLSQSLSNIAAAAGLHATAVTVTAANAESRCSIYVSDCHGNLACEGVITPESLTRVQTGQFRQQVVQTSVATFTLVVPVTDEATGHLLADALWCVWRFPGSCVNQSAGSLVFLSFSSAAGTSRSPYSGEYCRTLFPCIPRHVVQRYRCAAHAVGRFTLSPCDHASSCPPTAVLTQTATVYSQADRPLVTITHQGGSSKTPLIVGLTVGLGCATITVIALAFGLPYLKQQRARAHQLKVMFSMRTRVCSA